MFFACVKWDLPVYVMIYSCFWVGCCCYGYIDVVDGGGMFCEGFGFLFNGDNCLYFFNVF